MAKGLVRYQKCGVFHSLTFSVIDTVPTSSTTGFTPATNQVSSSSLGTFPYDAAGNVMGDGLNSYRYDGEGRLCAVQNSNGVITGYIYDAGGTRVAKAALSSLSCNFSTNGYATTTSWVLGPGGEQVTEYSVSGSNSTWVHTNAFASGQLLATYRDTTTYFALNDWLGTKRAEVGTGGCASVFTSMPFGDGLSTAQALTGYSACTDATEHHFTGKERDAESGNDYFEARYYSSAVGRFMSPDWSAQEEPVPYAKLDDPQSLNLYAYVQNNPLIRFDKDGHDFVILNDSKGAQGEGHNASVVGNDKQGWTYFSANGYGNGVSMDNFKTFSDFQKSDQSKRYDNADRISTTTKQDAAMKETGGKEINKPYSISAEKNADGTNKSQNCADLTAAIGKSGGVAIGTPQKTDSVQVNLPVVGTVGPSKTFTSPNQQYSGVVQNNNGTKVKAHCTGNNCN